MIVVVLIWLHFDVIDQFVQLQTLLMCFTAIPFSLSGFVNLNFNSFNNIWRIKMIHVVQEVLQRVKIPLKSVGDTIIDLLQNVDAALANTENNQRDISEVFNLYSCLKQWYIDRHTLKLQIFSLNMVITEMLHITMNKHSNTEEIMLRIEKTLEYVLWYDLTALSDASLFFLN